MSENFDLLGSLFSPPRPSSAQPAPQGPERPRCSRKACRADATWALSWRNPRIHTDGRTKTWLACDEHREWLADYLRVRDLLLGVTPFLPHEDS